MNVSVRPANVLEPQKMNGVSWFDSTLLVEQLMNKYVSSIDSEASAKDAASKMAQQEIGSLVISEKNRPVGIVTERDMLSRVVAAGRRADAITVRSIMSKPLICGRPDMDVKEAARLMVYKGIKKLPVSSEGQLVGILTLTDLCGAQIDQSELFGPEVQAKLPKRFIKRLTKRYYKT